jgi:hypothetical protein
VQSGLGLWSVYDRGRSTGTHFQGGRGPSSVFIMFLGPSGAQIWCCADDQVCQLVIPGLFIFYFSGSQRPFLDYTRLVSHHIDGVLTDK